jgi:hypothetical protein
MSLEALAPHDGVVNSCDPDLVVSCGRSLLAATMCAPIASPGYSQDVGPFGRGFHLESSFVYAKDFRAIAEAVRETAATDDQEDR